MIRALACLCLLAACDPPPSDGPPQPASEEPPPAPAEPTPPSEPTTTTTQSAAPTGNYEPCGGKKCGDACTICAPDASDCVETMEVKMCDKDGKCSSQVPVCKAQ